MYKIDFYYFEKKDGPTVPRVPAKIPPTRGVQVLLRLNAETNKLYSAWPVPRSLEILDLRGPRT
jgi:hypothetical protein